MKINSLAVTKVWAAFAVLVGGLITLFYAGLLGALHLGWLLLMQWVTRWNPAHLVPYAWLTSLAGVLYWLLLFIHWDVQDERHLETRAGPKVVEMNHGSFLEMFLGYWMALRCIRGDLVIVVKKELADHPVGRWLIVRPMQFIDRIILLDREDREASMLAIRSYIERHGKSSNMLIVIFCDPHRPTEARRNAQNLESGSSWKRVMRPSRGGAWLITSLLNEITGGTLRRLEVCHGLSRPQQKKYDFYRVLGAKYWARIRDIVDPLPETPEAYGPELTARWEDMDKALVARQET